MIQKCHFLLLRKQISGMIALSVQTHGYVLVSSKLTFCVFVGRLCKLAKPNSWIVVHLKTREVFRNCCERYDVTSMMVRVNDEVSEAFTKMGYKQCPAPVVTLRKRIYFNNNWTNGTTGFDVMGRFTPVLSLRSPSQAWSVCNLPHCLEGAVKDV